VFGEEKRPAIAVDTPHGVGFGKGIEVNYVAVIAGKFPIGEDDYLAGFTGDAGMSVTGAIRFGDVLIAIDAEEFVFARFGDLLVGQNPRLTAFGGTRLAKLGRVGPRKDA